MDIAPLLKNGSLSGVFTAQVIKTNTLPSQSKVLAIKWSLTIWFSLGPLHNPDRNTQTSIWQGMWSQCRFLFRSWILNMLLIIITLIFFFRLWVRYLCTLFYNYSFFRSQCISSKAAVRMTTMAESTYGAIWT
jgi:hypothetical protein